MKTNGDIQVAVLSSRPTLDLAINTWLPGYLARSSTDLDVIVDLTQDGGVIVIDLLHEDGPELIRTLRSRGVDTPIVVLASASRTYEPPLNGDVVVANSAAIDDLAAAFEAARAQHRSRGLLDPRSGDAKRLGSEAAPTVVMEGPALASDGLGESNADTAGVADRIRSPVRAEAGPDEEVGESRDAIVASPSANEPPVGDPTASGENGPRTGEGPTPPGMFVGRESPGSPRQDRRGGSRARRALTMRLRARELLEGPVADGPWRAARSERPRQDADAATSPADAGAGAESREEPLEVIDLTEPLFPPDDSARSTETFEFRDHTPPVSSTTDPSTVGDATRSDELATPVIEPVPTSPPPSSPPVGSATSAAVSGTSSAAERAVGDGRTRSGLVDAWSAARAWVVLDALEPVIGSGSAVVAVPTSAHDYGIVAGIGIAPFEARRSIPMDHPVVAELERPGRWFIRAPGAAGSRAPLLPLAECVHLLALAIPGATGRPDAIVVIGRHEPFGIDEAAGAAATVQDHRQLDAHLRRLQAPGTALTRTTGPQLAGGPVVLAGWQVLDDLFPLLDGAAAAVAFRDGDLYAVSAAVRVEPAQAGRVLSRGHALLHALRSNAAGVIVRAAGDDRALVSGLPLPRAAFVAGLPLGDVRWPHGVALLSHHRRIEPAELERWHTTLLDHPVQSLGE